MKKILSCLLVALFIFSLVACTGGNKWKVSDVIDASASQQRWLKRPSSTIVINPSALEDNASFSKNDKKLGIEVGVMDADGNVAVTLEDVCMFLEANGANGLGGEVVWTAIFEGEGQNVQGHSKLLDNGCSGTTLSGTVSAESSSAMTIRSTAGIPGTSDDKYYMVFQLSNLSLPEGKTSVQVDYSLKKPSVVADTSSMFTETGNYLVLLNEIVPKQKNYTASAYTDTTINPQIYISQGTSLTVSQWSIIKVTEGLNMSSRSASSVWYPYMISTTQGFDFGTVISTNDMITGSNMISRCVTVDYDGAMGMAGYLNNGTASLENKNSVLKVTGNGFEYSVSLGRFSGVKFFDSLEDMLQNVNGSEEPTATSQYWSTSTVSVSVEETFIIGLSASVTNEDTVAAAKSAGLTATVRRIQDGIEEWWNEYIAANDVSEYISRHP